MDLLIVVSLLLLSLGMLVSNRLPADVILAGALSMLLIAGVLTPVEALQGFANPGVATIGVLYIVVAGLRETGAIIWLSRLLLGRPSRLLTAQLRLFLPVATLSVFINNSPVVAMFIGAVQEWCKRSGFKSSFLLLPLSYASILGGTCSLIGTSTNLIVDGLMQQSGYQGFGLFELATVGIPLTLIGCFYLLIASPWILTDRTGAMENFDQVREYMVEMWVTADCELAGKSIQEAGLRHLPGLFLVEIIRQGELIPVVSPSVIIQKQDRLVFAGAVDSVVELRRIKGLVVAENQLFKLQGERTERRLFEAVISAESPSVGVNVRKGRFRHRYNAVILSIARNGQRLKGKLGDITLQAGDTLLIEAEKGFMFKFRNSRDFLLISRLENSAQLRHEKAPWALAILSAMVMLIAFNVMGILQAAILAAFALAASRCLSLEDMRRSVDIKVLLVIACAFGLGAAVQKVGLAQIIANQAILWAQNDPWLFMILLYVATVLLTEMITNNAAAIVMFPIANMAAAALGVSVTPYAVTIMIAASASFVTPIGYQTNLMVLGPGGYQFTDYIKLGLPLSLIVGVIALNLIPVFWALA